MRTSHQFLTLVGLGLLLMACQGTTPQPRPSAAGSTQTGVEVPKAPQSPPLAESQIAHYRQAFANAASFAPRPIPEELLSPEDRGNATYILVRNGDGTTAGYLRDFSGPVTPEADCPCSPLSLTMAFDAQRQLTKIFSAAPLTKYGHTAMSPEDMERLLELAKAPPEQLLQLEDATQLVDGMSGPTRKEYTGSVVPRAALSTWRIARLVRSTQQILVGAPVNSDSKRLETMIRGVQEPLARARAVAAFLPTAESETLAQQAYRVMSRDYFTALKDGAKSDPKVEAELLAPHLPNDMSVIERIYACYNFANTGVRLDLATACFEAIKKSPPVGGADVELGLLEGTLLHRQGKHPQAIAALGKAAQVVDIALDPMPHLRLALSLAAVGEDTIACTKSRTLYVMHPALEGVKEVLKSCVGEGGSPAALIKELDAERRIGLLSSKLEEAEPLGSMSLSDENMAPSALDLAGPGKVTVLAFFATWCPHCQAELPKLTALAKELSEDPQRASRVQVIGVRTAVEREKEPYLQFKARFGLNFPVFVDPTLSLVFGKFCRDHGRQPALPTLGVVDRSGRVRYFIDSGEHRNLREDLMWAVDSLL